MHATCNSDSFSLKVSSAQFRSRSATANRCVRCCNSCSSVPGDWVLICDTCDFADLAEAGGGIDGSCAGLRPEVGADVTAVCGPTTSLMGRQPCEYSCVNRQPTPTPADLALLRGEKAWLLLPGESSGAFHRIPSTGSEAWPLAIDAGVKEVLWQRTKERRIQPGCNRARRSAEPVRPLRADLLLLV